MLPAHQRTQYSVTMSSTWATTAIDIAHIPVKEPPTGTLRCIVVSNYCVQDPGDESNKLLKSSTIGRNVTDKSRLDVKAAQQNNSKHRKVKQGRCMSHHVDGKCSNMFEKKI